MEANFLIGVICCGVSLIVHILSLICLCKGEGIRKNKCLRSIVILSVSDALFAAEYIYSFVNYHFTGDNLLKEYQSVVLSNMIGSTILFSSFQTFQVCLEILNATFLPPNKILTTLTSVVSFTITSIVCLCLTALRVYMHISYSFVPPEGQSYDSSTLFYVTVDLPSMVILGAIVVCFMITIRRLAKHNAVLGKMANTSAEKARMIARSAATKRNMKTLVAIFCLTIFSYAPREVCLIIINVSGRNQQLIDVLWYLNIFIVLKPVFDPPIFMFRLKTYRKELRSILFSCIIEKQ